MKQRFSVPSDEWPMSLPKRCRNDACWCGHRRHGETSGCCARTVDMWTATSPAFHLTSWFSFVSFQHCWERWVRHRWTLTSQRTQLPMSLMQNKSQSTQSALPVRLSVLLTSMVSCIIHTSISKPGTCCTLAGTCASWWLLMNKPLSATFQQVLWAHRSHCQQ